MKTSHVRTAGIFAAGCLCAGMVQAALSSGTNLYIDGGLASNRVFQHEGMACVPVADIAKAMNKTVVTNAAGYAITSGGAGPVQGLNGVIGDKLSSGQVVFTVVKVTRTDHYTKQFDTGDTSPSQPNNDLVIVQIRVKSAISKTMTFACRGGDKTALTDQDSHSYEASRFSSDIQSEGANMLPGSAADFALAFNVPKNEKIGDLVYEVSAGGGVSVKPAVFRVSLASANP